VLRDADAIDEGILHSLVTEQITDAVFDLMRWSEGSFAFVVDEPNRDGVGVSCSAEDVVTEARRRLDIWASLDAAVVDPDATLTIALELESEPQVSTDEWSLIAMVDGQRSIGEIVDLCGRGEYAVTVSLADLVSRKLLQVGDSSVAELERRQEQISTLEAPSLPASVTTSTPAFSEPVFPEPSFPASAEPLPPAYEPPPPAPAAPAPYDFPAQPAPSAPAYADPSPPPAAVPPPAAPEPRPVVPQRDPGPFTSGRPVAAAPSQPAAATAGAPGGSVSAIERDPNVNKSLLLRLIAGVRGL
jgi:hypothetical protein